MKNKIVDHKMRKSSSFKTSELEIRISEMNLQVKWYEEELDNDFGGGYDENM